MITCAACGAENVDSAKFCVECGAPQRPAACPGCGAPAGRGKFCAECGTAVSGAAPSVAATPMPAPTAERRLTSVLFGDLVGFTTLSEARDPEEVRELLSRYFDEARTVVQRYGGTVEKFIGDAVMAVWGVPVAHEDDAERAVRAGLDLVTTVATLGEDVGMAGLELRVGVVTGEVAVTLGATGEGMVAGDAVNTAARVQTAAQPGTVWVDEATRGLTSAAVTYTDAGTHALKGKAEPAMLWQARAVVAAVGGAQRVDGLEAPFTGRDRDLRLVKELFHATVEEGSPRLVTVIGVAGIGKSRLGWEFEKYIDGLTQLTRWHRGRCLSYGEGIAFWAFAEMVRSRLGITELESRDDVERLMNAGLEEWVPDPEERSWVGPRLAVLLGKGDGSSFERADLFAGWTLFLERVGGDRGVVLVFEDLQYADSGLLDLVDHLVASARFPLFVLALTRPELLERRPSLASGRRTTPLYLEPLGEVLMTNLVRGLVDGLPEQACAALVRRAEGVPLYAVETVRSLIDRDAVVPLEGRYVFVDRAGERVDLSTLAAPASLQTLIAARLDALSAAERRAVQDASVLGLSFSREGLAAISGPDADVDVRLESLVRKEILELQSDPRSTERGQYHFLQALVRQVAYDTLSRRDRKSRHLAVAAHLAESVDDTGDLAAVLAQHHLDALDASSSDDQDRDEIAAQARALLARAAVRAEALGAPAQAFLHAERALNQGATGAELHELQELAARNARLTGSSERAIELARAARVGYESDGRQVEVVRTLMIEADALRDEGRVQPSIELLTPVYEQMKDAADALSERFQLADALSGAHVVIGAHDEAQRYGLRAMQLAEAEGDRAHIAKALYRVSLVLQYLGAPTASRALLLECTQVARQDNLTSVLSLAMNNLAALAYPRELAVALPYAVEALTLCDQLGDRRRSAVALINVCLAEWLSGQWDSVDERVGEIVRDEYTSSVIAGLEVMTALIAWARGEPVGDPSEYTLDIDDVADRAAVLGMQALARAQAGDLPEAARLAETGMREYVESYGYEDDLALFWVIATDLAVAADDRVRTRELLAFAAGAPRASRTPMLSSHEALYRGLLAAADGEDPEALLRDAVRQLAAYGAAFPLARARMALGSWLGRHGAAGEAAGLLDAAATTFRELRAVPSLAALAEAREQVPA